MYMPSLIKNVCLIYFSVILYKRSVAYVPVDSSKGGVVYGVKEVWLMHLSGQMKKVWFIQYIC